MKGFSVYVHLYVLYQFNCTEPGCMVATLEAVHEICHPANLLDMFRPGSGECHLE
jgi:hypothetical protein